MQIREMTRVECLGMLGRARLARLACAHENQPYVVPIYFAYDEALNGLYGFTFPGRKVEWMRANPRVCIEVDEIVSGDQWTSVIGLGRYEELSPTAENDAPRLRFHECLSDSDEDRGDDDDEWLDERERAWQLLKTIYPVWFEPHCTAWAARVHHNPAEPVVPIFFKIRLDRVTGHQATPDVEDAIFHALPATAPGRWKRLRGTFSRALGGR